MEWIKKEDYTPKLRADIDPAQFGIGLIGCGNIANQAHLPAYRKLGLHVVACCDVSEEAAKRTAEAFNIPFWTTDIRELLALDEVKVLDMAVHPGVRMKLLEEIAQAPRPVLCQKPLAVDLQQAYALGSFAEEHGIMLGINQQARWAPAHRAMHRLLEQGVIGETYHIQHVMRSFQDMAGWWWTNMPDFNIVDHGIHYLDLCRFLAQANGRHDREWTRLHCTTAQLPNQHAISPMMYAANIEYGDIGGRQPFMASLQFNNIVYGQASHSYTWWVDGEAGSVYANHDKLFLSLAKTSSTLHEIRLKGSWFPDGFAGSMAAFLEAVADGRQAPVTLRDHYRTVAMTTAMVQSSQSGQSVSRQQVMQEVGIDDE